MHRLSLLTLAVVVAAAAATGCDDEFGPSDWSPVPDTVALYSLSRAEYQGLPSAVDITDEPVFGHVVEAPGQTGGWDFVLEELDGVLAFSPAGALSGIPAGPGIAVDSTTGFDAIIRAPGDTAAYHRLDSVPVSASVVYVARSRVVPTFFGARCVRFAKFRTVEIDPARGIVTIEVVNNVNCNDRSLIPPDED
ncbi:MAG TPA: hypothetical protein VF188_08730 [Longimicrobiales bacterium]